LNQDSRLFKAHPATVVLATFLLAIVVGTGLLMLPPANRTGSLSLIDALFTATSAVCVTGLAVVDTGSHFTRFGQLVILALIQLGGLGVMTISVILFRWFGRMVSFRHRMVMQDLFSHTPREDIFSLLKHIIVVTFATEAVGALLLTMAWLHEMGPANALYNATFHSISAFCNAGFALFPDSLVRFSDNLSLNLIVCALIVLGGLGFPVLYDLQTWLRRRRRERVRLTVQTKTVLIATAILILGGWLLIAILERQTLGSHPSLTHRLLTPLFQSITCRTAGFNTLDIAGLQNATLALMLFLMFFGASPGSCGGGVKTTTLALIVVFTYSRIKRRNRVDLFKKSIPIETVNRSLSLILISISIIGLVLFMLFLDQTGTPRGPGHDRSFLAYLFEAVSAFGTVGLSMGITPELSIWDKCWIIITMLIGRIGVLTFSYIIIGGGTRQDVIEHAEENIMIG
jgi:trk system potassium uptake protein TrkH